MGEIVYPPPPIPFNYATTLLNDASVMLTGIGHCNRKDKWIIAHSGSSIYSYLVYSYLATEAGVSAVPVITTISPSVISAGIYAKGNFKFSANSEKMIMPVLEENKLIVFNFNDLTGRFSNPVTLKAAKGMTREEVEISPDGSKVYLGTFMVRTNNNPFHFESHFIFQMDLDAGSESDIEKSTIELSIP